MSLEEQQFAMIENLTEELGEKETKIMELENLIEKYQNLKKFQKMKLVNDKSFKVSKFQSCKASNF